MQLFWVVTLIAACAGGFQLANTFVMANSAPQQAAGAALAVAITIVPYVFTRALEGAFRSNAWKADLTKVLLELTEARKESIAAAKEAAAQLEAIKANTARTAG